MAPEIANAVSLTRVGEMPVADSARWLSRTAISERPNPLLRRRETTTMTMTSAIRQSA